MGVAYPRITTMTLTQTDPSQHGSASSALQAIEQISTSALTALTGAVFVLVTVNAHTYAYAMIVAIGLLGLYVIARPARSDVG